MKFATLTTSAIILSATLVSGNAFAQRQTVTVLGQGDSYTCHYQNNYLFSCERSRKAFYVPPVPDPYPPTFFRKSGGGGNEGGGGNHGGGGNRGGGGNQGGGNAGSIGGKP